MQVEIIHPSGRVFRQVHHEGQTYLVAPRTGRYWIRLHNEMNERVMAVVSVDGLNVIHGGECSQKDQGYLLGPYESCVIKGWTRSRDEVAEFNFTSKRQSYSAKMGKGTRNTSIVGVAVFREKRPAYHDILRSAPVPPAAPAYEECGEDTSFSVNSMNFAPESGEVPTAGSLDLECSTRGRMRSARRRPGGQTLSKSSVDLGTGYGKRTEMQTTLVSFEPRETPEQVVSIRYGTRAKLGEWGVPLYQRQPEPFPAGPSCPAPPGWRG